MELVDAVCFRPCPAKDQDRLSSTVRNIVLWVVLLGTVFTLGCAVSVEARDIPTPSPAEPTPAPQVLDLPADDASHDSPIEWWYYNGHLESDDGAEYSFHFVIFQLQEEDGDREFEFGQAGITDVRNLTHIDMNSERVGQATTVKTLSDGDIVNLDLDDFTLQIDGDGAHLLDASDEDSENGLTMFMEPPTTVMLHEGIGWMSWPFGWTYYYSYPRMSAEGVLKLDGEEIDVSGEVWFDHQWGDFFVVGHPAGWQWFALHLDDGRSLMASEVRGAEGQILSVDATLIDTTGEQLILESDVDGIKLEELNHWLSPHTGGEYPSEWRLSIDSLGLDLLLSATILDQEVPAISTANQAAAYWEGRIDVVDSLSGEHVGRGFAELSGYVVPAPLEWQE